MNALDRRIARLEEWAGRSDDEPIFSHRSIWRPGRSGPERVKGKGYRSELSGGQIVESNSDESLEDFLNRLQQLEPGRSCYRTADIIQRSTNVVT